MSTIFSKIIDGTIPCFKLVENDFCFSFLDIKPLAQGHALVIPKVEIDYIFDVPDDLLCEMILFSKRLSVAIKKVVPCTKVGLSIIGLEVPHAHIHLIPINAISELNFNNPRLQLTDEEFKSLADRICRVF